HRRHRLHRLQEDAPVAPRAGAGPDPGAPARPRPGARPAPRHSRRRGAPRPRRGPRHDGARAPGDAPGAEGGRVIPNAASGPESAGGLAPIRVEGFSGPLDLLLHLARSGGIDLRGLPVVDVARQCDAYVRTLEAADLEAAGDHLVM